MVRNDLRLVLGTLVSLALPQAAFAEDLPNDMADREEAIRLLPNGSWNIDFGEQKCRLAGLFGPDDDRHLLMFEQAAPDSEFGLTLAGPSISRFVNATRIHLGMERDEAMRENSSFRRGEIASVGPAIIIAAYDIGSAEENRGTHRLGIDLDEAGTIDRVVLRRGRHVLSFETGNMMPPMQALNTCTSDLLRVWGLDPDEHEIHTPAKWTNSPAIVRRIVDQYPSRAAAYGEQAIFRMRVIVERDGTVSDCHLENSTEVERLESPACREMMQARFDPALGADGEPIRSYYATTVTYRLGR